MLPLSKVETIYKRILPIKPPRRDGQILNLHPNDDKSNRIRLINGCFNTGEAIAAVIDNEGAIFLLNFETEQFWNIPKAIKSITVLEFSNQMELLIGTETGVIFIVNIENGCITGELNGHKLAIKTISFANNQCLSASLKEAIIWNMKTITKMKVLNFDHESTLKYTLFMPVSNNIMCCFDDDLIQVWDQSSYEIKAIIEPKVWSNYLIKSVDFSVDGKLMAFGCAYAYLALFLTTNYTLLKLVALPNYIQILKSIKFLPNSNETILAILSGRGIIYFYDIDRNTIISELVLTCEISTFFPSHNGNFLACILSSGDLQIYNSLQYIETQKVEKVRAEESQRRPKIPKCNPAKQQLRVMLDSEKLSMILKQNDEYPDQYRAKIWGQLLGLPNEFQQYNSIINNRMVNSFTDLNEKYPLEDKRSLKNLRCVLDNIVTWAPFFHNVDYLPNFAFPFVRVFNNQPIICFEAICTIIMNWCQFWFEYYPLPPINILAMIENLLLENDPELLNHLMKYQISSSVYAWPFLQTAFSEVFSATCWKVFWDHVLSNEPSFLLCAVVAYNIMQRTNLLSFDSEKKFYAFYNTPHPIDLRKMISRTYVINGKESIYHPRQYLRRFQKLKPGKYPIFIEYPKAVVHYKSDKSRGIKEGLQNVIKNEVELYKKRLENYVDLDRVKIEEEENKRILRMEAALKIDILNEQRELKFQHERLLELRRKCSKEEQELNALKSNILYKNIGKGRGDMLDSLLKDFEINRNDGNFTLKNIEEKLKYHFGELSNCKHKIEKLLNISDNTPRNELTEDLSVSSDTELKMQNLITGVQATDLLIKKIEDALEQQNSTEITEYGDNYTVNELQYESDKLQAEVNKLFLLLRDLKNTQ